MDFNCCSRRIYQKEQRVNTIFTYKTKSTN